MEDKKNEIQKKEINQTIQDALDDWLFTIAAALIKETHNYDDFDHLVLERDPYAKSTFKKWGPATQYLRYDAAGRPTRDLSVIIDVNQLQNHIYFWLVRKKIVNVGFQVGDNKKIIETIDTTTKNIEKNLPPKNTVTITDLANAITQIDTNTNNGINDVLTKINNLSDQVNNINTELENKLKTIDKDILNTQTILTEKVNHDTEQIINGN